MTSHKHFKQLVRTRMAKTGESYSTARRQILGDLFLPATPASASPHMAGNVAATTALRIALTHAGLLDPRTRGPLSEALLFGIAGGIGIGTFAFVYEQSDVATFYIAGRHRLHDDNEYLQVAAERCGLKPIVTESTSEKKAAAALAAMLEEHGPCIAWVDAASLPHRAMPEFFRGGGYHVVTVYSIDGDAALIGDLTDTPVSIPLDQLAAARGRIKKQKNRLMTMPRSNGQIDLAAALREGLRACCDGLAGKFGVAGYTTNFSLESLRRWSDQLHGAKGKESWEHRFTPGGRLWQGLISIHDFIEHYGTGGGLCRPLFATCLAEAAIVLNEPGWQEVASQYARLGQQWSELADSALADDVPLFLSAKQLLTRKAELINSGGHEDDVREIWRELDGLGEIAKREFPLTASECSDLRQRLKSQVHDLYESEVNASQAMASLLN